MILRVTTRPLVGVIAAAALVAAAPAQAAGLLPSSTTTTASADATQPALMPSLVEHLAAVSPLTPVRVLVQAGGSLAAAKGAVKAAGLRPEVALDRIGIAVAVGTPAQIAQLGSLPGVTRVDWADEPLAPFSITDQQTTRAVPVHDGAVDVDGDGTLDKFDGSGFSVAIVDSGTDGTHPMFTDGSGASRVKRNMKVVCSDAVPSLAGIFFEDEYQTTDGCTQDMTLVNDTDSGSVGGHGTHVTGIAAGSAVVDAGGRKIRGSAPGADIVAVSTGATLSIYGGVTGLHWVLEHHADPCGDGSCAPIVSVNNSWGPAGGGSFSPTSPQVLVQRALVAEGVTVVWAAGNDGGDGTENMTNPYSVDPTPGVLSVANYDDAGTASRDNALDSSSSRGLAGSVSTYPDISAPGANITSACRVYLPICATGLDTTDPDYNTISGTSMAAPHIAGYVAVLQQAAMKKLGRLLTPGEVEDLMLDTAHKFGSRTYEADSRNPDSTTTTSFDAGHGLVDVLAAVERLTGTTSGYTESVTCPVDGRFTDPAGDATGALGAESPGPNAEGLDILEAWFTSDEATGDTTLHWKVADLADAPGGLEGTGEYFDANFSLGGGGYYLGASRAAEDGGETYLLGRFNDTGRETLASGLPGAFDPETDEVSITLTAQLWKDLGLSGAVTPGQQISGVSIVGRRSLVLLVPDADTATSGCAYTIGAEHAANDGGDTGGGDDPVNTAPTAAATATPASVSTGEEVTFDATGSTDAETPEQLGYSWDFGDGGATVDATGAVATRTFAKAGTYQATVTVSDPEGLTSIAPVTVTVTEPEPVATNERPYADAGADRTEVYVKSLVRFSAEGSTDAEDGSALSYAWNFGDGGDPVDSTDAAPTFRFAKQGRYAVVLTVTDSAGAKDTDKIVINVGRRFNCESTRLKRTSGIEVREDVEADGGAYCFAPKDEVFSMKFDGPRLDLTWGRASAGGVGYVVVDGTSIGKLNFKFNSSSPAFGYFRSFTELGEGTHTVEVRVRNGRGYLDQVTIWR